MDSFPCVSVGRPMTLVEGMMISLAHDQFFALAIWVCPAPCSRLARGSSIMTLDKVLLRPYSRTVYLLTRNPALVVSRLVKTLEYLTCQFRPPKKTK